MSGAPVVITAEVGERTPVIDRLAVEKFLQTVPALDRVGIDLVDDVIDVIEHYRKTGKRRRCCSQPGHKLVEDILYTHWRLIADFVGLSPDLVNIMQTCKQWRAMSLPLVRNREVLLLVGNPRKFDASQNVQYFDLLRKQWIPFVRFHPDWVRGRIKAKLSAVYSKTHGLYIPSDHLRWNPDMRLWKAVKNIQCDSMIFLGNEIYSYKCFDNWGSELYLEITKRLPDEQFTPSKRIVREIDPISAPYRVSQYQGACMVIPMPNGSSRIGFFGGSTFISKTSCCLLEPESETWTDLPDLPLRVFNNTGTFWNGCVVIAGGSRTAGRWAFNNKVCKLDITKPGTTWIPLPEMPREHGHCMLATLNGDLVALMSTSVTKPAVLYRYSPRKCGWVQLWNEINACANSSISKDGSLISCPYSVLFPHERRFPSPTDDDEKRS